MLKGIPPILSPELLKVLAEMGHTDEITIADGNFPGHSFGKPVGKLDTPIWDEYKEIVAKYDERGADAFEEINKWKFYDQTREKSCAVIMTSENALYANIILRKGVV